MTTERYRDSGSAPFTPEQVAVLVRAATAAPSVHNSQPWRFRDHDDQLDLLLDGGRPVTVADPDAREQVISCGAALGNLRLAMGHLGHDALVTVLPDADDPDHLATIRRGAARPTTASEALLYDAIYQRRSHRRPFDPEPVSQALLDELSLAGTGDRTWVREVATREDHLAVVELAADAAHLLLADPGYRGELSHWTRHDTSRRDGVGLESLGTEPYPVSGLPWALLSDSRVGVEELRRHPILVLGTKGDTRGDWLSVGEALQRLLLLATARGLAVSLFTQTVEVPALRTTLRRALGLSGPPQLVLRLGYPMTSVPRARRRALESVFVTDAARLDS